MCGDRKYPRALHFVGSLIYHLLRIVFKHTLIKFIKGTNVIPRLFSLTILSFPRLGIGTKTPFLKDRGICPLLSMQFIMYNIHLWIMPPPYFTFYTICARICFGFIFVHIRKNKIHLQIVLNKIVKSKVILPQAWLFRN
jgi:hypothetical protein